MKVASVVVGADLGTTTGTVYIVFVNGGNTVAVKPNQSAQWIKTNKDCTKLNYTIYSKRKHEIFYLAISDESKSTVEHKFHKAYLPLANVSVHLLCTPPMLNVTLLACPPGFTLAGNLPGCECLLILTVRNVECIFRNEGGYHAWNSSLWLTLDGNASIVLTQNCPYSYCITGQRIINLEKHPDSQCSMN